MTSLSTPQAAAEPAAGTTAAGRPVEDRAARIERLREAAYRVRLNALLEGEVQGQGYIGQALGVADVLAVVVRRCAALPTGGPALGGAGPVAAVDRALRDRPLRGAGRGRDHPGRGAGDLRLGRVPVADVGDGVLHPGHGDLRRLARARSDGRDRDGAGVAPPGQPGPGLQPAVGRRAGRGLDVGGRAADRPPRSGQRHRDRRRQRPAGRRPHRGHPAHRAGAGQVAGLRLARAAGRRQRHRRTGRRVRRAPRPQGLARGADLRHPHRLRRAAAGDPGEGPLHARRRTRMADRPRPAEGRLRQRGTGRTTDDTEGQTR